MLIRFRETIMVAAAAVATATAVFAQDDPHAACTTIGWAPPEVLQRPVTLREGTGNSADAATTSSNGGAAVLPTGPELSPWICMDRGGALLQSGIASGP